MSSIPISKDGGLEPHLTYCPRCGGDGDEITVGVVMEMEFNDGMKCYANRGQARKAARDIGRPYDPYTTRHVEEGEKLPASQPCKTCRDELATFTDVVKAGGIYFHCKECNKTGVIRETNPVCAEIKEKAGVAIDEPAGIEFEKCEEHGGSDG